MYVSKWNLDGTVTRAAAAVVRQSHVVAFTRSYAEFRQLDFRVFFFSCGNTALAASCHIQL